jgi:UDP-N-acetylmuramyl pentapeptide phosphotransferase/UDP-N-acetylglucosamine-1-phosphate transferase
MDWTVPAAFFIAVLAATAGATRLLMPHLARLRVIDRPNERSSHVAPTPRGGGLALVPVAAIGWLTASALASAIPSPALAWAAIGALALCALSWVDDLRSLSPAIRLAAHAVIVALLLVRLPDDVLHFQGLLPLWADRLAAGLAWLWFINLFNFMDGIDGISGVETIAIGAGVLLIGAFAADAANLMLPAAALAGAGAGFLVWNWHPAKVFLGDAGSVPLGLMLGWLLLELAARGFWAAALILPLYYLTDATFTILRRAARGDAVWRAHREHFYQKAVQRGLSHSRVALLVAITDVALVMLAARSIVSPWPALLAAVLVTAGLLALLRGRG